MIQKLLTSLAREAGKPLEASALSPAPTLSRWTGALFPLPDHKRFKTCTSSLGMKPSHPAGKFPTPSSFHGHHRGKRSGERGPEGQGPSTEQLMCGASAQELLAQRLSSRLLLEREDSKR